MGAHCLLGTWLDANANTLLSLSTCTHLKNNCKKLKNLNLDNLDMDNYVGCHIDSCDNMA